MLAEAPDLEHSGLKSSNNELPMNKFSDVETLRKSSAMENGLSKGIVLNVNHVSSARQTPETDPKSVDEMSLMRRSVFALSFLPSLMFVLCFAVILPCEQIPETGKAPSVQEIWSRTFYNIVLTTRPNLLDDFILTYSKESISHNIASLSFRSGIGLWNSSLKSEAMFIDCGNLDWNGDGSDNCLVMDKSSHIYVFNALNGKEQFFDLSVDKLSTPIILPQCKERNASSIAFPVSISEEKAFRLRVLSKTEKYDVLIPPCNAMPYNLMTWTGNDTTDLLYYCDRNLDGDIMKIPQGQWCEHKLSSENVSKLIRMENSKQPLALLTNDGLVIWNEKVVVLIDRDGKKLWKFSSGNHSTRRRFLKFGKFCGDGNQVALISGDNFTSQITILNAADGNETWTTTVPDAYISDVYHLSGKGKDFVLLLIKTVKFNLTKEAEAASAIENDTKADPVKSLTQRIALVELGSKYSIHVLHDKEIARESLESSCNPEDILSVNVDKNHLKIVSVSWIGSTPQNQRTLLRGITVENWDISDPGSLTK